MSLSAYIFTFVLGCLATLVTEFFGIRVIDSLKAKKSDYSGTWRQRIYKADDFSYSGPVIKEDVYDLKCCESSFFFRNKYINGMNINIHGTIKRELPLNQNREWRFIGYIADEVITILYEPTNTRKKSRGCIYLRKVRDEDNGNDFFRGFYLEEHKDGSIDKTPLTLTKEEGHANE